MVWLNEGLHYNSFENSKKIDGVDKLSFLE